MNKYFVPIHLTNEDYVASGSATPEEKAERARIMSEVFVKGENNPIRASDAAIYILNPQGHIIKLDQVEASPKWAALKLPDLLVPQKVIDLLEEVRTKENLAAGKPVVAPRPQSWAPKTKLNEIVVHLTARYAPSHGTWKLLPSEDWIILDKPDWTKLLPKKDAKVGDTWTIDQDFVVQVLSNFYPPTSNRDPSTNKINNPKMTATVVSKTDSTMRIRLDSALTMKHRFFPVRDDDHQVEAKVVGYVDCDRVKGTLNDLRLVTETATYANDNFGISVRLHKANGSETPQQSTSTGSLSPTFPAFLGIGGFTAVLGMVLAVVRTKHGARQTN